MTSPEEIHAAIRLKWVEEYCKNKGIEKITKNLIRGRNYLQK